MAIFDWIMEIIKTIVLTCYYILEGMVKAVLPAKYLSNKDISKDTVLVTGAGSGIGRALSISLAKLGCTLILWDINEEGNQETAAEIKRFGGQAHSYTVDVSKKDQVYAVADKVLEEVGKVDILVNNAGILTRENLLDCSDDVIEKTLNTNSLAHFWTTKAFLPQMVERNKGHIVAMASAVGLFGVSGLTSYCCSKYAVIGYMESLMSELKSLNKSINTTVVCPSPVDTPLLKNFDLIKRFPVLVDQLTTDYVASQIIEAIEKEEMMVYLPRILYLVAVLNRILPERAFFSLFQYLGLLSSLSPKCKNSG